MTQFINSIKGWQYLTLNNLNIFVKSDLNKALDSFWSSVMINLDNKQIVGLLIKVKDNDGTIRTLGPLFKFSKTDRSLLRQVINLYISLKGNNYLDINFSTIIFQYIFLKSNSTKNLPLPIPKKAKKYEFGNYSLPLTTDLNQWPPGAEGEISNEGNKLVVKSENYDCDIWVSIHKNKQVYNFKIGDSIILKVTDYFGKDSNNFTRVIGKQTFIITNGEVNFKRVEIKTKFITKIAKDKVLSNNILTLDIETRIINNVHSPYCISFFDGTSAWSYYISDYASIDEMLINALNSIIRPKYEGWNVYVHNGSGFDFIFLLKHVASLIKVDLIIKDGKFINIKLSWENGKRKYSINFRDSLLMLPSSLRKLAKAFGVESKGYFPFNFVNNFTVPLDYIGHTPNFSYFEGLSLNEYNSLVRNNWNLREETIHYCEHDCKVLYQILFKFNKLIFNKFSLNIHRFPTLSSLAFGIFRSSYLGDHKIPKLGAHLFDFIKQGYTGGRVDVIKTYGENLYYYDVNSLYPTVYSSKPMPTGSPKWFTGNILDIYPQAFGFFKCEIESPSELKIPLLQTHVKTKNGTRTMAPLGQWVDILFSEEAKLAMDFGYKIKVIEGYTFEKEVVFDKYAQDMFDIKQSHDSSHPMYLISKLLLNSLYGKFGMTVDLFKHAIVDNSNLSDILSRDYVENVIDLDNGESLISIKPVRNEYNDQTILNVSIGIAASITAYSRIHMSQFLQSKDYNVYYTDTDSIVTDKALRDSFIGKGLGQLKLEYNIAKGVFLAPKVYSIINDLGKVVTKVKGLKDPNIPFDLFESLLYKNSSTLIKNEKWFRSLTSADIKVKNQVYELSATENKEDLSIKIIEWLILFLSLLIVAKK